MRPVGRLVILYFLNFVRGQDKVRTQSKKNSKEAGISVFILFPFWYTCCFQPSFSETGFTEISCSETLVIFHI